MSAEMNSIPPDEIGGAKVLYYTVLDDRHSFTGNTKQVVDGELLGAMSGLVICSYSDAKGCYLFGCNEDWQSVTDTYHESVEDAMDQAEFEYAGTKFAWKKKE